MGAAVGLVFTRQGSVISEHGAKIFAIDAGQAEAYTALKAVELLLAGETNLIIYTDSLELVRAFQN